MNTHHTLTLQKQSRAARSLPQPRCGGFTLVELLVTIALIGALLSIAVPSLASMGKSVKLSSASNLFVSGLFFARSEAIKRNIRVVLCKSADGENCAAIGGWEQGWIVFDDTNNNGQRDGAEAVLQREAPLAAGIRLVGNLNVARYVSFTPSGATKLPGGAFQAGTLTVCHHSADPGESRQIVLNAVGRPRVQKATIDFCD